MHTKKQMATNKNILRDLRKLDESIGKGIRWSTPVTLTAAGAQAAQYAFADYSLPGRLPYAEKRAFAGLANAEPQTVVNITEEDVERFKDVNMAVKKKAFDNWVGNHFAPYDNPAARDLLRKIYPEWFDSMKKSVEEWHKLKSTIEKLKLVGATNKEELYLLWQATEDHHLAAFLGGQGPVPRALDAAGLATANANFIRGVFAKNALTGEDLNRLHTAGIIDGDAIQPANILAHDAYRPLNGRHIAPHLW